MKLTEYEALDKSLMVQDLLAITGWDSKKSALKFLKLKCNGEENCFLCEYIEQFNIKYNKCSKICLVKWPSKNGHCNSQGSPFNRWDNYNDKERFKKYARQIADLILKTMNEKYPEKL